MGTGNEEDNEKCCVEFLQGGVVDSCQAAVLGRRWDGAPLPAWRLSPASLVTVG